MGVSSKMLVGKRAGAESEMFSLDHSLMGRLLFWGRFIAERLYFLFYERDASVRYAFSPAVSGAGLANHPLVKNADVIHLHWINFGFLSIDDVAQLVATQKPIVWTLHDMWAFTGGCHYSGDCVGFRNSCGHCQFLRNPGMQDLSFDRLQLKKRKWDGKDRLAIVACSQWLAAEARSSSLLRDAHVVDIPNPIATEIFKPFPREAALKRLGLPVDKKYILFAAAKVSSKLKGFGYLKEALKILTDRNAEFLKSTELLVIGGGDATLLEGIPLKAHFLGYVKGDKNLVDVYNAATIYITPSVEDNLPNTVMESLACGTPVVGFRTGGIPEMVDHQVNGFIAEYKQADSLAEGIEWTIQNDSEGLLSEAARRKVIEKYDERLIAARYLQLYQNVLRSHD